MILVGRQLSLQPLFVVAADAYRPVSAGSLVLRAHLDQANRGCRDARNLSNRAGAATLVSFDWHGGPITRLTPITKSFRSTQNVRRFFKAECGAGFKFDRTFMAWLKDGKEKTMGDAADEWLLRAATKRQG